MDERSGSETTADREVVIARGIDGPRDRVFDAFTAVDHLSHWWGPDGFTTTTHTFEFRPGGVWDFTMHGPDGTDYPNHIEWLEIAAPERLVFRHGERPGDPEAFVSTVTIADLGERSEVSLRSVFNTKAQRDELVERYGVIEGGKQTLGRLDAYVVQEAIA
jgi:uncharacterized protein YndB with AHSA1/START domain